MTTATPRQGQRTRAVRTPLLPGDIVTLKTMPDLPFTVKDQNYIEVENFTITRVADGGRSRVELLIARCEIATATRPAPLLIVRPDNSPEVEPDWRDAEPPAFTLDQAELVERPEIEWGPVNSVGQIWSKDGRFEVFPLGGTFTAIDHVETDSAFGFALRADAVEWCEKKLRASPDADTHTESPGLVWAESDPEHHASACGRFKILPPTQLGRRGDFQAIDSRAESPTLRYSAHGTLDACKAWCEERAKLNVGSGVNGVECLVRPCDTPF